MIILKKADFKMKDFSKTLDRQYMVVFLKMPIFAWTY